jgi:hypothetical protein
MNFMMVHHLLTATTCVDLCNECMKARRGRPARSYMCPWGLDVLSIPKGFFEPYSEVPRPVVMVLPGPLFVCF